MNIALKEAGETDYWLDVIHSAGYFSDEEYTSLDSDNKELTNEVRAESKPAYTMPYKEEDDEVNYFEC